ncbi:MAG: hypothetical protein WAQ24_00395 [Candidatus Saccharimonadales bacterium]
MSSSKIKLKSPKLDSPKLSTVKGTSSKQTIYVDVDDEITAIIDKLNTAKGTIIALVLPKRASVLQSVVNMKLLKRSAEQSEKNLVLVTTEASLLPLAGLVGLHVAQTPTSKPVIPKLPEQISDEPDSIDESLEVADMSGGINPADEDAAEFDPAAEAKTPIGTLAGATFTETPRAIDPVEEMTLEDPEDAVTSEVDTAESKVAPVKHNKKLAVPSFEKFRLRVLLGVLLLALLVAGWFVATVILPKAEVSIATNSQFIKSNLNLTLDTASKEVELKNSIVPAVSQSTPKTYTQQVAATGQQNNGQKASGTVLFTATQCAPNISEKPDPIPIGSSITSNSHTYITQKAAMYSFDSFTSGSCALYSTKEIDIIALKAGSEYNLSDGSKFSGSGLGVGSASGGTDVITKVVAQSDIDNAKAKIASQDTTQLKTDLQTALKAKGVMPVPTTFLAGDPQVSTSAKAGDTADTVTVTSAVTYTMLGLKQADLQTLVVANVKKQINQGKQKILDDGVAAAVFTQQAPGTPSTAVVAVQAQSVAGPEINAEVLKKQVAGKRAGDIKSAISSLPGVTEVQVKYSPFWVSTAPKDTKKITIIIAKPTGSK